MKSENAREKKGSWKEAELAKRNLIRWGGQNAPLRLDFDKKMTKNAKNNTLKKPRLTEKEVHARARRQWGGVK